jgi:hypothetical protein
METKRIIFSIAILTLCNTATAFQAYDILEGSYVTEGDLNTVQLSKYHDLKYRPYSANSYIISPIGLRDRMTSHAFSLLLPDSKRLIARTLGITENPDGSITWLGTLDGDPSRIALVLDGNSITGRIIVRSTEWWFHPLGDGFTALVKVNQAKMPPDGSEIRIPYSNSVGSPAPHTAGKSNRLSSITTTIATTIIDVLILYTDQSESNIDAEIESARSLTNSALSNSQIDANIRIIEIVSANISGEPTLNTCVGNPNCNIALFAQGSLVPDAASLRNQYGADIVVLVSNGGGLKGHAALISSDANHAYVMVNKQFASGTTLGHEIGHIVGGNHNPDRWDNYYPSAAGVTHVEGHGYNSEQSYPSGICTMMATGCGRDLFFSTTAQSHQGPSGTVYHGLTEWSNYEQYSESPTEMTSVWEDRAATVSNFRSSIVPPPPPPPGSYLDAEITGATELAWKENATLSAGASYQPDDDTCTGCTYSWYERQFGGSWYSLGVFTETYYMTMLWTQGIDYKVVVDDGIDVVEDIHHIDYCSSGCGGGGGPKRPISLTESPVPTDFTLSSAYPNPFNPTTTINFDIPLETHVTIEAFDLIGDRIATITDRSVQPGSYYATWNATSIASGIYLLRLRAAGRVLTTKVVLLK